MQSMRADIFERVLADEKNRDALGIAIAELEPTCDIYVNLNSILRATDDEKSTFDQITHEDKIKKIFQSFNESFPDQYSRFKDLAKMRTDPITEDDFVLREIIDWRNQCRWSHVMNELWDDFMDEAEKEADDKDRQAAISELLEYLNQRLIEPLSEQSNVKHLFRDLYIQALHTQEKAERERKRLGLPLKKDSREHDITGANETRQKRNRGYLVGGIIGISIAALAIFLFPPGAAAALFIYVGYVVGAVAVTAFSAWVGGKVSVGNAHSLPHMPKLPSSSSYSDITRMAGVSERSRDREYEPENPAIARTPDRVLGQEDALLVNKEKEVKEVDREKLSSVVRPSRDSKR